MTLDQSGGRSPGQATPSQNRCQCAWWQLAEQRYAAHALYCPVWSVLAAAVMEQPLAANSCGCKPNIDAITTMPCRCSGRGLAVSLSRCSEQIMVRARGGCAIVDAKGSPIDAHEWAIGDEGVCIDNARRLATGICPLPPAAGRWRSAVPCALRSSGSAWYLA